MIIPTDAEKELDKMHYPHITKAQQARNSEAGRTMGWSTLRNIRGETTVYLCFV